MTNQAEALRLFEQANGHWFGDMKFNLALPLYREAVKHDPSDPVILYQLANVLCAYEEFDEAREIFLQAQQHQDSLSDFGKQILAKEQQRLLETTSFQTPLPLPATELSFEKLEAMELSHRQWLDIAYDAEDRRMYNLAAEARDRGFSSTDFDNEKDKMKLYHKNIDSYDDLQLMRLEAQK